MLEDPPMHNRFKTLRLAAFILTAGLCGSAALPGGTATADENDKPRSTEELARAIRDAVVVVVASDREGESRGLGSGFVIGSDGVIATNFHVIGEGRPFKIQSAGGKTFEPLRILATDKPNDLAVVQVDAKDLPSLELADSESAKPGQPVLAVGNPFGLRHSVSDGVVAEFRELAGRRMIQLAMPIEPGSSGSPVVDRQGRVLGIISIKSLGNIAFAVPSNNLKAMLDKPRPIEIARWLTIGALDSRDWTPRMGGSWRQRAGRIVAEGPGAGFGGRTLCLSAQQPPDGPFELAVDVRLKDESGAAGLVFHSDGGHKHYGFYPTAGSMRLTRFEGPDVTSWTIIETAKNEHYRPGEWNSIKVRVDGAKLQCFVNDELAITAEDAGLGAGKIGLVKFREPGAEFRHFRVADRIASTRIAAEQLQQIQDLAAKLSGDEPPGPAAAEPFLAFGPAAMQVLRDRARALDRQAERMRQLAADIHAQSVQKQLLDSLAGKEDDVDLVRAALLLAKLDNEELEIEPYERLIDRMAAELRGKTAADAAPVDKFDALRTYMFDELGFHGSGLEYYHRSNSYLNEVLDDREGIPITLSIVFIELARRTGIDVVGIGMPGHFLAEFRPTEGDPKLVDVFGDGRVVTRDEAQAIAGRPLRDADLAPTTKRAIILRMLHNLLGVAQREQDLAGALRYLNAIIALDEQSGPDRLMRAAVLGQSGRRAEAEAEIEWLLKHNLAGADPSLVRQVQDMIRRGGR
jgi:S1-C subfamily serine protease/regulator of sirC expression with transglutaminase-like and TPR domain